MNTENILKQKIGLHLTGVGNLSKIFAVQSFSGNNLQITPEQFTVLALLYENDELYQRQLSTLSLKDRANISRIVNILEGLGFVTKTPDVNGRKVYKIKITEEGKSIYKETLPVITSVWRDTAENISDTDLKIFHKVLYKIQQNLISKVNIQI